MPVVNYVQISGTFEDGTGAALSGTVTFTPNTAVYSGGVRLLTPDSPVTAQVNAGQLRSPSGGTLQLLATDNAGLTFAGQTGFLMYAVSAVIGGDALEPWQFFLPFSTLGAGPVDLYSLANTDAGGFQNPMTAAGDMITGGTSGTPARLAGNTSATREFLVSQGTGSAAQAPAFGALQAADVPFSLPRSGGTMTGWLAPAVVALSQSAGSVAVNAQAGNVFTLALTASGWTVANPSGPVDGQVIRIRLTQDVTGSRTVSWGSAYDWGSGNSAPALSTAASATDILAFEYLAGPAKWAYLGASIPQGF